MARALKIYNGSGYCISNQKIPEEYKGTRYIHIFACGYSIADVSIMINEFNGYDENHISHNSYITKYWSKGCWGNSMKDVTPERGLWIQWADKHECKPVRVL